MKKNCLLIGYYGDHNRKIASKINEILIENNISKFPTYTNSNFSRVCLEIAETGTYLISQNITIGTVVSFFDQIKSEDIKEYQYACILTRYFNDFHEYRIIIQYLREQNPNIKIIISGGFLVNAFQKLKDREKEYFLHVIGADYYIIKFECARELSIIIKSNDSNDKLKKITNIHYKYMNRYIYTGSNQSTIQTPISHVDWKYFDSMIQSVTSMKTTISCPFSCSFCAVKSRTETFGLISLDNIRKQLQAIRLKPIVDLINFTDETINLPKRRFHEFLNMLIDMKLGIPWCSFIRCDYIDEETANLMKKSGCQAVLIGFESGCDSMLKRMNKRNTTAQLRVGHSVLKKHEILTFGFFITGFPMETEDSIRKTIEFIDYIQPTFYKIHKWSCEIGTDIWNERKKYELKYYNGCWKHKTMDSVQASEWIERMNNSITGSINIDDVDFTIILSLIKHNIELNVIKEIIKQTKGRKWQYNDENI